MYESHPSDRNCSPAMESVGHSELKPRFTKLGLKSIVGDTTSSMSVGFRVETHDAELDRLSHLVAASLGQATPFPEIPGYVVAPRINSAFNVADLNNGSVDLTHNKTGHKIVFYKAQPQEEAATTRLRGAGLTQVLQYPGRITLDSGELFLVGRVEPKGINLTYLDHSERGLSPYYGTFTMLEDSARLLAAIHRAGLVHGGFTLGHLILSSGADMLRLYGNWQLQETVDFDLRQQDVQRLLRSLDEANSRRPHDDHKQHFLDRYTSFMQH